MPDYQRVRDAIQMLGVGDYKDGSSASPGHTYQPLGDLASELADVPCHKPDAVRDDFRAVYAAGYPWEDETVLDLAAANGYYSLLPCAAYFGLEADARSVAVAQLMGIPVTHCVVEDQNIGQLLTKYHPSTILALNCPMWWAKQGTIHQIMEGIGIYALNAGARVLFQVAGRHSGGMARIYELDTEQAERKYLERYFGVAEHIRDTELHGGVRRLWMCT